MHDEIHIIDQHPLGLVVPFDMSWPQFCLLEAQFHFVRDSLHLPRISPVTQHKVVSEGSRPFFHLQNAKFLGLFIEAGLNSSSDLLLQFSLLHSPIDFR